jgi:hypothetical protein
VFASIFTDGLYAAVMVYAVSLLVVESAHWLGLVDRTMKQSEMKVAAIMFQMRTVCDFFSLEKMQVIF